MKILVAYDGSSSSDQALNDLKNAGLPDNGVEALVVSVAEVWMPPEPASNGNEPDDTEPIIISEWAEKRRSVAKSAVSEADTFSRHAREKISAMFPEWTVNSSSTYGSPAWEILTSADDFDADLITIGSQGRNAIGRILLGSVSQKVLAEAKCSVRIARHHKQDTAQPNRIMIGFDCSKGSDLAVKEVARRNWTEGTEVRLVWAAQSVVPTTIGRFVPPVNEWIEETLETEKGWFDKLSQNSLNKLEAAGLKTSVEIKDGNPKDILVDAAAAWNAKAIFVGAHSYSSTFEKMLIGCSSAAVAERAGCSVEAVRTKG